MRRSASIAALVTTCFLAIPVLVSTPAAAQYGPDTCRQGYVWREAFAGDHACVRWWQRAQAESDNAMGPARVYPDGRCFQGYVWRESFPGDHVCVTPETRARVARDNVRAPYRFAY
jgi:hypothetical protein